MNNHDMTNQAKRITGSRKKQFRFYVCETHCTNSYWDGGSRTQFEVLNIDTGARGVPSPGIYPWTTPNNYTLKPGEIMIETGTFCGKPSWPCISCRPDDEQRVRQWLQMDQITVLTEKLMRNCLKCNKPLSEHRCYTQAEPYAFDYAVDCQKSE